MAEARPIRKIVILGRDETLWLSANILLRAFSQTGVEVTAVELPSLVRPGDVYPTLRMQEGFHGLLGLDEKALMRSSQSTFSLGQRFSNWAKTRPPFFLAHGVYGTRFERVDFHHYWVKARAQGLKADYDDFSLAAAAAKQGRFFIPDEETDSFALSDYAYNLGAAGYCQVLKQVAQQRGAVHITGRFAEAMRDADTGFISSLLLANGQTVEGDLFIDASGEESLLLGQTLGVPFQSWDWFNCDRVLTAYAQPLSPLPSFNQLSAFRSGWVGCYPLRDRTAVQQIYTSAEMSDQEALEAATLVSSYRLSDPAVTRLDAGARRQFWSGNCIAVGEASAVFDPIDNVRMHVNLVGLSHLVSLLPADDNMGSERDEYNRSVATTLERMRDFQICHYKLNQRFDQPFWDYCRAMSLPDRLQYKLDLFAARGVMAVYDDEVFEDREWVAMLIGHGLIPAAYDLLADQVKDEDVIRRFQQILGFIRTNVERMGPMEPHLGMALPVAVGAR